MVFELPLDRQPQNVSRFCVTGRAPLVECSVPVVPRSLLKVPARRSTDVLSVRGANAECFGNFGLQGG